MKFIYALFAMTFVIIQAKSQTVFESGYIIYNNGTRAECKILNKNWLKNPEAISYKLTDDAPEVKASVSDIKEFGVGDHKYVAADVMIDQSPKEADKLTSSPDPVWVKERAFLRVISEGEASLYHFSKKAIERFLLSTRNNDSIRQLVYKPYKVSAASVAHNKTYQAQLIAEVSCPGLPDVKDVDYTMSSLRRYFAKFNECKGVKVEIAKVKKASEFHLTITPGIDFGSFKTVQSFSGQTTKFHNEKSIRLGLEAEIVLPFNSGKWALLIEPTYQSYETSDPFPAVEKSIEMPAGARHYFFLDDKSRIFVNAGAVFDFSLESTAKYAKFTESGEAVQKVIITFFAGAGFKYSRFGIEGRLYTEKSRMGEGWFHVHNKVAVIIGYRIF
jgi:hypothetical protein